jgi:hypothetical protein
MQKDKVDKFLHHFLKICVKENEYMFFQQGSLTAYTANNSMATLYNSFGNV